MATSQTADESMIAIKTLVGRLLGTVGFSFSRLRVGWDI
jgi:hypothetical protein